MPAENRTNRVRTLVGTTYERAPDTSGVYRIATVAIEKLASRGVNREQLLNWVAAIMISSGKSLCAGGLERVQTFESDLRALLCEFVHRSTHGKHYCYEQLADVLTAAYQVSGRSGRDRTIAAKALRKNWKRYATSDRIPRVLDLELDESRKILRVLIEIEAPVPLA